MAKQRPKVVYLVRQNGDDSYWSRQGVAFPCKDGSLNMRLDMLPDLSFNIRDQKSKDEEGGEDDNP